MPADNSRVRELQAALREKVAANKEIADNFAIEDGVVIVDAEKKAAFDKNMRDIREIKSLIEAEQDMSEVERWGEEPTGDSVASEFDAKAANQASDLFGAKTLGQAFVESHEFKSLEGGRAGATMNSPFIVEAHDIASMWTPYGVKDVYSAMPSGTPGSFGRIDRDPIVLQAKRTRRVRDLFPARRTTAAVIEYFRQTGFTNNASMVPERDGGNFALKPQSTMTFQGEQAPVRTMAHWEAAHRNVLADEPQLRSIIDNELLYGLRLTEDNQILNGAGTGEDLLGILNTPDIQTYSWSSGETAPVADTMADAIRRAATLAFLAYYEPTGVVLHPTDWEKIELTKATDGQYLVAVSVALGGEPRLWRLPVVDTPAIAEGTALVGAFGTGAQIYDREQANIRVAEQHSDFFTRNGIVVLAEQRLALATKRPESFVKVTFDAAPS